MSSGNACPLMWQLLVSKSHLKVNFFEKKVIAHMCLKFKTQVIVYFCVVKVFKAVGLGINFNVD